MPKKLLGSYQNGNYTVHICEDGTKIRHNDLDHFAPAFPESIDMKICNRCDMQCPMCHERSTPDGKVADLNMPFLETLQPYTELAIGGGNPLEHSRLSPFLYRMRMKGVICNMTVHQNHFMKNIGKLTWFCDHRMVHGLGVSVQHVDFDLLAALKRFPNAVVHVIAGLVSQATLEAMYDLGIKLLILGYKDFGRGEDYHKVNTLIDENIMELAARLPILAKHFPIISFDNLAIEQLNVRGIVGDEVWEQSYMGDDGQFTMYVDLVEQEYAVSSTSPRRKIDADSIEELFRNVQGMEK